MHGTLQNRLADPDRPAAAGGAHAVVIGSGFGGLAAAIRLAARGFRVTVLEAQDRPGGRAAVFTQDGHTFDTGPTIVTAPFLFEELWQMCGRTMADDVPLKALDPFFRVRFDDGETFAYSGNHDAMLAEIARLSPGDTDGYERFMREAEAMFRVGFEQLGDVPFDTVWSMLKVVPQLVSLGGLQSVHALAAKHVKDERIRIALSFHPLFIGGNPFTVTSVYALISYLEQHWGVHYAMGGTGALVKGMVSLVEGQGSTIRTGAEVTEITLDGRRATGVRLASGETIAADIVVSNADVAWTYRKLVPAAARRRWTDRRLERARYSSGLFVWYFGTNRRFDEVDHHTILLGPRYRGLLDDIFSKKVLAEDFSLYLHRPTATDRSLAPDGCDTFYVLSPVPHLGSGIDWAAAAEPYRRAIAKRLSETLLPGFEDAIATQRVATPQDFQDRLLSYQGAAFSLEPVFTQSAWFRPHNRSEDVEHLYIVGAGTHPGAGLPGVLSTARVLDRVVPDPAEVA